VEKKIDHRLLQAALKDWNDMNTNRQWAKIYCTGFTVYIDYGTIHSNGDRERAIGSRSYYLSDNGGVKFVGSAHA
jgi:hypothetical protein